MEQKFCIALLQLNPPHNEQESLASGLSACGKARALGSDLAVFPELWQVGYQQSLFSAAHALDRDSTFIQQFCAKAKELEMAIAVTYLGNGGSLPTNNVVLIDRTGTIVLEYAKVNICDFKGGSDIGLRAGKDFHVVQLQYAHGTVCVGAMICYDRESFESARVLARKGAEVIIVPNACRLVHDPEIGDVRLQQIRARAFENMVVMAVANYPAPADDGNSCVCIASGAIVSQAGANEEILLTDVDLAALRTWRACNCNVWGPQVKKC